MSFCDFIDTHVLYFSPQIDISNTWASVPYTFNLILGLLIAKYNGALWGGFFLDKQ